MKTENNSNQSENLESILQRLIIESADFAEAVERIARQAFIQMNFDQRLTTKQMAEIHQVSRCSIARLTERELDRLGWKRIKIGTSVRFERIELNPPLPVDYKRAKRKSE